MSKKPLHVENIQTITGHSGAIYDIIYSDNHIFSSGADKFIAKWDPVTGEQTNFTVKLDRSAYNIAYAPNSKLLGIGTNNGDIHVIDLEKREEIRLIDHHKHSVFALTYCELTNQFYSGDRDGVFCAWDGDTFDLLITLPFDCMKIREISVSEDGKHIAICAQDSKLRILETTFFNHIETINTHDNGINCALFDGDFIYTGGKDAHINKWNWKTKEKLLSIPGHNYAVYDLEFIDNKSKLVSVSFDKTIKIWNTEDISIIERIEHKNGGHRHVVNRIAKIDEQTFATSSDDRKILIWKLIGES